MRRDVVTPTTSVPSWTDPSVATALPDSAIVPLGCWAVALSLTETLPKTRAAESPGAPHQLRVAGTPGPRP